MTRLRDRPTSDLIVIALTAVVAGMLIIGVIGVMLLSIFRPHANIEALTTRLGTLASSLVGAIVGYLAGRNVPSNGDSGNP